MLLKVVRTYVSLNRYESLTLHQATQGLRTSGMPWINAVSAGASKAPRMYTATASRPVCFKAAASTSSASRTNLQQRQEASRSEHPAQQSKHQHIPQHSQTYVGTKPKPAVSRARHVCDMQAVCSMVWWLLAGLVTPLIRAAFYVTETEPYKQQVFYFRCGDGCAVMQLDARSRCVVFHVESTRGWLRMS